MENLSAIWLFFGANALLHWGALLNYISKNENGGKAQVYYPSFMKPVFKGTTKWQERATADTKYKELSRFLPIPVLVPSQFPVGFSMISIGDVLEFAGAYLYIKFVLGLFS